MDLLFYIGINKLLKILTQSFYIRSSTLQFRKTLSNFSYKAKYEYGRRIILICQMIDNLLKVCSWGMQIYVMRKDCHAQRRMGCEEAAFLLTFVSKMTREVVLAVAGMMTQPPVAS